MLVTVFRDKQVSKTWKNTVFAHIKRGNTMADDGAPSVRGERNHSHLIMIWVDSEVGLMLTGGKWWSL